MIPISLHQDYLQRLSAISNYCIRSCTIHCWTHSIFIAYSGGQRRQEHKKDTNDEKNNQISSRLLCKPTNHCANIKYIIFQLVLMQYFTKHKKIACINFKYGFC